MSDENILPAYIPGGSDKWRVDLKYLRGTEVLGGIMVYGKIESNLPVG